MLRKLGDLQCISIVPGLSVDVKYKRDDKQFRRKKRKKKKKKKG